MSFTTVFYGFIIYSIVGWISECLYARYIQKKWVNRGFLSGPICPIYGTGAMLVTIILQPLGLDGFSLFAAAVILTSVLEFGTSYIMEKIWHLRWWDYSDTPFNFEGRICLSASIVWGIVCVFMVKILNPTLFKIIQKIPENIFNFGAIILLILFLFDLLSTIIKTQKLSLKLVKLSEIRSQIKIKIIEKSTELAGLKEKYKELAEKTATKHNRVLSAFPSAKSVRYSLSFAGLKQRVIKNHEKFKKYNLIFEEPQNNTNKNILENQDIDKLD